jgi:hypothetical protein
MNDLIHRLEQEAAHCDTEAWNATEQAVALEFSTRALLLREAIRALTPKAEAGVTCNHCGHWQEA